MMELIGLHARLHAGKDTAYEVLCQVGEEKDLTVVRRAFADPLKFSGLRALGMEDSIALANAIKETGRITITWEGPRGGLKGRTITGRQYWQWYGTEAHRSGDLGASFGEDFWVDNLLPEDDGYEDTDGYWIPPSWESNFKSADLAVVTDVRFPNEAQRIIDLGGQVWKIDADERLGPNEDTHASEIPLADKYVTKVIDNNGTLEEFAQNIRLAVGR